MPRKPMAAATKPPHKEVDTMGGVSRVLITTKSSEARILRVVRALAK
uniref:Uncharacterized protein n=1 Tax=Moniliophthora roreri TaxID=221103 RepID=A0A0W0G870_MONRR